jgi:hypothetical protein
MTTASRPPIDDAQMVWEISLSSLRVTSRWVNNGLFGYGVVAIVAAGTFSTPLGELLLSLLGTLS